MKRAPKFTVLVVDDEPLIRDVLGELLRDAGYDVAHAENGRDALAVLEARPVDVILLDLRLPDGSGLEIFEQIRSLDERIPVIFVTVDKAADSAIEAMKRGAFDYLSKPLDPAQLRRALQ